MRLFLKNLNITTRIFSGFIFMLLVVFVIITVSYKNSNTIISSSNQVAHTHEVLNELKDIEARLIDMETGQRGFLITGTMSYLEPYNRSLSIIDEKIEHLYRLTADNPHQTDRIDALRKVVDLKIRELNLTVELMQQKGFETAREVVVTNEGKDLMDQIREKIAGIAEVENSLLEIRALKPYQAKEKTFVTLRWLLFAAIVSMVIIAFLTAHSIKQPLKALHESTQIVGRGNLDHKSGIQSKDEIGQLSKSFESMLEELKGIMASKDVLEKEVEIRKRTEENLTKAKRNLEKSESQLIESNRTKDKFFAIIAHDLKSPFTSMLGFSRLLNEQYEELSERDKRSFLDMLQSSIESSYFLLENLLMWSQNQGGQIEFDPVERNLYLIVKDTIDVAHLSAEAKSIQIKNEIPQNIFVHIDENMFSSVLRNLVSNAIKFTPNDGEITLSAELKGDTKGIHFVEVRVRDNGVGIPKDKQGRLFDVNENLSTKGTANEGGTGLGLGLCKDFISRHNGELWVESVEGEGSSFYFTLPLDEIRQSVSGAITKKTA